jgi:hypothetical protein
MGTGTAGYSEGDSGAAGQGCRRARILGGGAAHPLMGQLRKLAEIYKRPLSHFYLLGPPKEKPLSQVSCPAAGEHRRPSTCVAFAIVRIGSHLAVPLAGGGLLSGVKLKKEDQELTLGFEGRLVPGKQPYSAAASNGRV